MSPPPENLASCHLGLGRQTNPALTTRAPRVEEFRGRGRSGGVISVAQSRLESSPEESSPPPRP